MAAALTRPPIEAAKNVLRTQVKKLLATMPAEERVRQSQIITQKVLSHERFKSSSRVSLYLSMEHEVDTFNILKSIFAAGKECFIPKYDSRSRHMDMVRLNSMEEYENLPLTSWKIRQPADGHAWSNEEALETGGLDLIVVPGLAFTKLGQRLGSGRGYYDTYFDKCLHDPHGHPYTIGLAFSEQIFRSLPMERHDVPLDEVIYPEVE